MCTVTFIPFGTKVFITHNRDEKSSRAKAIAPAVYSVNGYTLFFPKDAAAGGSWIGVNEYGAAAVLLNGAFTGHIVQPAYRKSRGLVFLEILASADPFTAYQQTDLTGIEPFTVILWVNHLLYECRWDGHQKHIAMPPVGQPHTWSSVTLYNPETINKREDWFKRWLQENASYTMNDIIQYHLSAGDGDAGNNLRMNRNGSLLTVSITAIELEEEKANMRYLDLEDNASSSISFNFTKATAIQQ